MYTKIKAVAQKKQNSSDAVKISSLLCEETYNLVRELQKLATRKLMDTVIHVDWNKSVVADIHHTSVLPTFHPIIFSLLFISFIQCLRITVYGHSTDEIYFCDGKLVCKIYIRFLQLFSALISFSF